jgi:hypothetical protein
MQLRSAFVLFAALFVGTPALRAQAIVAQSAGLSNPDQVIDFGANVLPNFTPVTNQFAGITVSHASQWVDSKFRRISQAPRRPPPRCSGSATYSGRLESSRLAGSAEPPDICSGLSNQPTSSTSGAGRSVRRARRRGRALGEP